MRLALRSVAIGTLSGLIGEGRALVACLACVSLAILFGATRPAGGGA